MTETQTKTITTVIAHALNDGDVAFADQVGDAAWDRGYNNGLAFRAIAAAKDLAADAARRRDDETIGDGRGHDPRPILTADERVAFGRVIRAFLRSAAS